MGVGLIRTGDFAELTLEDGRADLVAMGRELLWNPNLPGQLAVEFGGDRDWSTWPDPYRWWLRRRFIQQGR
jgi:2,4-dienoyl-CoA reductase-like NADH-dependent reductase (Old Yellow Enzyme family)